MHFNRPTTRFIRVEHNLPGLTEGVRLDEVTFIVHVKTVVYRMVL